MSILLVGFDSAWTAANSGALVGAIRLSDGTFRELGAPEVANYRDAEALIARWHAEEAPTATIILLDQPTVVANAAGQRPVENIAAAPVSRRYGGMQPTNTGRTDMFGVGAPVWPFLARFGGPADPFAPVVNTSVFETYPVLALIALGWTLPDPRATGRLPKYNPGRRKTFAHSDWEYVCTNAAGELRKRGLAVGASWLDETARNTAPRKRDQDCLDAYLCLIVALHLVDRGDCLLVGELLSGYIVVPQGEVLRGELETRCVETGRAPSGWVRTIRLRADMR